MLRSHYLRTDEDFVADGIAGEAEAGGALVSKRTAGRDAGQSFRPEYSIFFAQRFSPSAAEVEARIQT